MAREDKLLKIIEGLQDTIRKLESERVTVNDPFRHYPYNWKWAHPLGCMCSECHTFTFTRPVTCTSADTIKIGDNIDEVS